LSSSTSKSSTRFAIIRYNKRWAVHDRERNRYAVTNSRVGAMRFIMDVTPSNINYWAWSNDPPKRSSSIKDMFAPS
jgi:hypothetical protein